MKEVIPKPQYTIRFHKRKTSKNRNIRLKLIIVGITILLITGVVLIFISNKGSSETSSTDNDNSVVPFLPVWIALIASTGTNARLQPKDAKQKSILIALMVLTILATIGTIVVMFLR